MLRSYARYFRQISLPYGQARIQRLLLDDPDAARAITESFEARFADTTRGATDPVRVARMAQAAAESEALQGDFGRRVVVVAEADPDHPVLWRRVVAVHVDTEEVDFTADEVPDLGWFATQEVPALLESSRSV